MKNRPFVALVAGLSVSIVVAAGLLVFALHQQRGSAQPTIPRPYGVPGNLSDATINLMSLSPLPHRAAPDFTFVDQFGKTVSLHDLRGKNVVLNFMDPHCTDVCPIVSQELIDANRDLGATAKNTVFLAINVNQYNTTVADVNKFSNEHNLNSIPTWHFLTGSLPALLKTWEAYGIDVQSSSPTADVQHTSVTYFINARGREQYLAAPMVDHTKKGVSYLPNPQLSAWGQGIAQVVRDLTN
ncbi:MAG: SCO family protein [Acidobacteriota bacterium]|nr:SCO family protein [Acidobacteriota bacterium]